MIIIFVFVVLSYYQYYYYSYIFSPDYYTNQVSQIMLLQLFVFTFYTNYIDRLSNFDFAVLIGKLINWKITGIVIRGKKHIREVAKLFLKIIFVIVSPSTVVKTQC